MTPTNYFFNWKWLRYFCGIVAAVILVGMGLYYGINWLYPAPAVPPAVALSNSSTPKIAAVAQTDPEHRIPLRTIRTLTISDVIPKQGKFIAADLVNMQLSLYKDGVVVEQYPIKTKGRPGTPWETPAGLYKIKNKERNHFSSIGKVYMPYSMQFYGNYFIHGWTYYPDGTPTPFTFSGGCIKLDTKNAEKVFDFAEVDTPVFVYDSKQITPPSSLSLRTLPLPTIKASAWLVADLDTGDVLNEHNAQLAKNPEYANVLMTALVANETISLDKKISVPEGALISTFNETRSPQKTFLINDLFYPLLLQANGAITNALASYYGKQNFVRSMNATALALDMTATTFAAIDSSENTTTAEDLYRLAWYLTNKKSFVLKIASTQQKTITAIDGSEYEFTQTQKPATIAVTDISLGNQTRHIAVITLDSTDAQSDSNQLSNWVSRAATIGGQAACVSCADPHYRKIDL